MKDKNKSNKQIKLEKYVNIASLAYATFTIYASLCLIKISILLPFLMSKEYREQFAFYSDVMKDNSKLDKNGFLFSQYGIYNICTLVIVVYILSPLFFKLCFTKVPIVLSRVKLGFKLYKSTLICWGVFFSIFLSISMLWKG